MYGNNLRNPNYYGGDYPPYTHPTPQNAAPIPGVSPHATAYSGNAPRPLHQRFNPPPAMFSSGTQYPYPSARTNAPELNPFTPQVPLPPLNHYLERTIPPLHSPFHIRAPSPDPLRIHYSPEEIDQLRSAGFRDADRQRLGTCPDAHFRFVMRYGHRLAAQHFMPEDTLNTARLSPSRREFVVRQAWLLSEIGFAPKDTNALAVMTKSRRDFVVAHGASLRDIGFSPLQMMQLANQNQDERSYVAVYGAELHTRGYGPMEIYRQARDRSLRPAIEPRYLRPLSQARHNRPTESRQAVRVPAIRTNPEVAPARPRRIRTSEVPQRQIETVPTTHGNTPTSSSARHQPSQPTRRHTTPSTNSLTHAEREQFTAMGLTGEQMELLAQRSSTVRTYFLVHGENLLENQISFDQILTMAEDTAISDNARSSGTSQSRDAAQGNHGQSEELGQILSRLAIEQISGNPSMGQSTPANTGSSPLAPIERPAIAYPRNSAELDNVQTTALDHAHTRWSVHIEFGTMRRSLAEDFYRDTVPLRLVEKIATGSGHPNLLLLLAGLPYAEDNRHTDTSQRYQDRVKKLTSYLSSTEDPELLRKCDSAAAEGVTHCGDRVAYGLTRVEQTILQHKIEHGEMPPRKLFDGIESVFLQPRVENIAAYLANARKARSAEIRATLEYFTIASFAAQVEQAAATNFTANSDNSARESLEMYAALTPVLISEGVHLVESAQRSAHGGMYSIDPLEKEYALNEIRRHVRDGSDDFLQEFEGNTAVETILRRRFPDDFRAMQDEREGYQEQVDELMFIQNPAEGTDDIVRETMAGLATMEKDWYRDKLKVVLRQRDLLDNLPPLPSDLVLD